MEALDIISELEANANVFEQLLTGIKKEEYTWKPSPDSWCILEILCHLTDEEVEDFRTRVRFGLIHPGDQPPPIDPRSWVTERKYMERSYEDQLAKFLRQRESSILWLDSLDDPDWSGGWMHPELGEQTAYHYLANWLAHDLLHIRQIIRLRYEYLKTKSDNDLSYAGKWK